VVFLNMLRKTSLQNGASPTKKLTLGLRIVSTIYRELVLSKAPARNVLEYDGGRIIKPLFYIGRTRFIWHKKTFRRMYNDKAPRMG